MTLNHWISVLRRQTGLVAAATATASLLLPVVSLHADEPLVTRNGRFQIPFDVEAEPGQPMNGFAVLYGSQDGGASWEQLQSVPAAAGKFTFNAPRDGRYAFAIRVADSQGNLPESASMQGAPPEMEVVVDTVPPDLRLELFDSSPNQLIVSWTCNDLSADPRSLTIEYSDAADGRWKPVQLQAGMNGQAIVTVAAGRTIDVRAAIGDSAGNRAEATAQHVSRLRNNSDGAAAPTNPAARSAVPLGPSPFADTNKAAQPTATNSFPSAVPANNMSRGTQQNVLPTPANHSRPIASNTIAAGSAPTMSGFAGGAAEPQMLNTPNFDLDYSVEDLGPSGVSAVELFLTEDGGQKWWKYGTDEDLQSPFTVDTLGEGTFGFAVRVYNGLGYSDPPPQSGQAPEIAVTVDQSAPVIEFAQPVVKVEGPPAIQLQWRVSDQNPSTTPVRLEYAAGPAGPWTPVFDWQVDQAGFLWAIRPGTPGSVYFRLLARDSAGNVSSSATPQPVIVDMKRPVGRLLRVKSVSQPSALPYGAQ